MRFSIVVLMLTSSTALAARCDQWTNSIIREWTSVFISDREMDSWSTEPTENADTYIEDLFGDLFPELMIHKLELSVPAKFQRRWLDSVPSVDDVGEISRKGEDGIDGIKILEDLICKLSESQLEQKNFGELQNPRKEPESRELRKSTTSQMVLTETVIVCEHQPTNTSREKIIISIAL